MPTLVHLGQNETGRINIHSSNNRELLMTHLQHCVAVVLKDEAGNISATHVDTETDLAFILAESKNMKGKFTIDVIKNESSNSQLAEESVLPYISKNFADIKNSKGESKVRKTKTGTLLFRNEKMLTPDPMHIEQLRPVNQHLKSQFTKNSLSDAKLDEGARSFQCRIYERYISSMLDDSKTLPTIVYDGKWTGNFPYLTPKAKEILTKGKQFINNKPKLKNYLLTEALKLTKNQYFYHSALVDKFPEVVIKYWNEVSALSLDSHTLFNQMNKSSAVNEKHISLDESKGQSLHLGSPSNT